MASPFRVFRKYLKPLMVVLGVMIMFSFVLLDPLAKYLGGDGQVSRGEDPDFAAGATAVSWEGGSLTNEDLYRLVEQRRLTNAFLENVEILGAQPSLQAGVEPSPLRVMPLRLPSTPQQNVEQSVVQTKLFADAARRAGMTIDDASIVQYLRQLGRERVSPADMRGILNQLGNRGVPIDFIFDAIRDEMLARNYLMSNLYAFQTATPQQRWQDWLRVNDRIVLEAVALPVESYLVEVKDPTEAEVKAFYEEHKDSEAAPEVIGQTEIASSRPGFRIPRKIGVQYLQANFADAVTKTEAEITDEEIAKYYEENKDLFIQADTGLLDDMPSAESPDSQTPVDQSPNDQSPEEENKSSTESDNSSNTEDGSSTTPADGEESDSAASPTDDATSDNSDENSDASNSDEPNTSAPADDAESVETEKSSQKRATSDSVFRQVAFLQDADSEGTTSDESEATSDPPVSDSDSTTAAADADAEQSTAQPGAEEAPATDSQASPPAESAATDEETKYQPLDEVRDLIRRDLAYRRVTESLVKKMQDLNDELMAEFNSYYSQVLDAQSRDEKAPEPPAALVDLAPLAEKNGLTAGKTEPMPWLEFRETSVGESISPRTKIPFSTMAFAGKDLEMYQPTLTVNVESNDFYIAMKTSDTPAEVPKFEDIRDQVVRAWKLQKAAEIALKDAEKQAKAAQQAGGSLASYYAGKSDVEIIKVDPFSQMTRGDVPDHLGNQQFRLSQPDGIVAPGPEFLRRAFELKDGEVGAVLNNDDSIAYVIRVVEHQIPQEELREAYLSEANTWDGLPAMTNNHVTLGQRSLSAELSGGGLEWKRTPDRRGDEDEPEDASEDEAT